MAAKPEEKEASKKALDLEAHDLSSEAPQELTLSHKIKTKVYNFIESTPVIIFMMTITVWVLFSDDIRQVAVSSSQDEPFYYIVLVCFSFFVLEILLTFYSKPEYRWGFFFWLDVISTLSLLLDTEWVSDLIFDGSTSNAASQKSAASLAKTARASRIGTRASRVVRIVRLIRLIRVVKLYKATKQAEVKSETKKKIERTKLATTKKKPQGPAPITLHPSTRSIPHSSNTKKRSYIDSKEREPAPSITPMLMPIQRQIQKRPSNVSNSLNGSFISKRNIPSQMNNSQAESQDENRRGMTVQDAYIPEIEEFANEQVYEETNVGKQLSDLTTKRVIILILSIMISIPIFSIDTYWTDYSSYNSGTQNLAYLMSRNKNISSNVLFQKGWNSFVQMYTVGEFPNSLLNISLLKKDSSFPDSSDDKTDQIMAMSNTSIGTDFSHSADYILNSLRQYEKKTIIEPDDIDTISEGDYAIVVVFDISSDFDLNSYLNIGRTIFVCIILSTSAIFFSKDATELVLEPIENMLKKVKRIAENPLRAAIIEEEQTVFWNDFNSNTNKKNRQQKLHNLDKENYETTILEKTIVKIGALLALGFGEAGAEIVAKNMQGKGEIDPMLPGKKVVAIFGFCDIRNFTDATEVLQEGVHLAYLGDGFCQ